MNENKYNPFAAGVCFSNSCQRARRFAPPFFVVVVYKRFYSFVLAMNKLLNAESSRILHVVEDALFQVETLKNIPLHDDLKEVELMESVLESSGAGGASEAMRSLLSSEEKLVECLANARRATGGDLEVARRDVGNCARRLNRAIRRHSHVRVALKESKEPETSDMENFITWLVRERDAVKRDLSTTVEQIRHKEEYFNELLARKKENEDEIRVLERELDSERTSREKNAARNRHLEDKISTELRGMKKETSALAAELQKSTRSQLDSNEKAHGAELEELAKEVAACEEDLERTLEENKAELAALKKKKNKAMIEVRHLVEKYDKDMEEKFDELHKLRKNFESEREELSRLEEYFMKIDKDIANEEEEQKLETWLDDHGLAQYLFTLLDENIFNLHDAVKLNEAALREMGISNADHIDSYLCARKEMEAILSLPSSEREVAFEEARRRAWERKLSAAATKLQSAFRSKLARIRLKKSKKKKKKGKKGKGKKGKRRR